MTDSASLPPGSVPVSLGEVLAGKYRVERVLGVGGMGVVVAATHLQLDQRVALKFMLVPGLKNAPLVERFTREARAAVRLKSDHVARVLDVGTLESGSPYMVMEFLEGDDLGTVLEKHGPLPIDSAVDCVLQACDAVAEAHSLGIVHRDLKPKNLFLTFRNDGRALVKVLDFGISKHKSSGDLSLTRTTEIIGSPNYMSPEQFRAARAADERSDIWALGVILYELLTGQVPWPADSVTQLTAMVLSEPPRPLHALRANVPDDLVRAIERCMQKDPAARFQTVAQLALSLQRFAPPDSRELANRIARIGASGRLSTPGISGTDPALAVGGGTPSTWAATTPGGSPNARIAIIATIAGLAGVTAVAGAWFIRSAHSQSVGGQSPDSKESAAAIASPPPATALASASGTPQSAVALGAPAATVTLAPLAPVVPATATARPTQATATATAAPPPATGRATVLPPKPPRAQADAGAGAGDDSPRYRTNW